MASIAYINPCPLLYCIYCQPQYKYLTLIMFAMQRIPAQGENERKETLALQSVRLTLLFYGTMNKTEQTK